MVSATDDGAARVIIPSITREREHKQCSIYRKCSVALFSTLKASV